MLRTLILSNTGLKNLPDEIKSLTNLTELDISDNQLTSLPPGLARLSTQCKIVVKNNPQLDIEKFRKLVQAQRQQSNGQQGPEIVEKDL
jgi:Leucine-rich repeat (LRR) protein